MKTVGLALILISLLTAISVNLLAAEAQTTATLGNTIVGSYVRRLHSAIDAVRYQLTEAGTVKSITMYFDNSGFNAKAAVYDDLNGVPGSLISQSSSKYVASGGWNTFVLPEKSVSAGYYWLTIQCSSLYARGRSSASSTDANPYVMKWTYYANEFSSTFGTPDVRRHESISIYATYAPATSVITPTVSTSKITLASTTNGVTSPPAQTFTLTGTQTQTITATANTNYQFSYWQVGTTRITTNPLTISATTGNVTITPVFTQISQPPTTSTVSVAAYSDSAFTNRVTSYAWGSLSPGTANKITVYVRNEGNIAVTLSKSQTNWNPTTAAQYFTLTWDYNNQPLNPGNAVKLTLTFSVSSSISGISNFSVDTVIGATG